MENLLIRPTISDVAVCVRFSAQSEQGPRVLGPGLELSLCHVGAGHVHNPGLELCFGHVGAGDVAQAVVVPVVVWPRRTFKYQCCWNINLWKYFRSKIQKSEPVGWGFVKNSCFNLSTAF